MGPLPHKFGKKVSSALEMIASNPSRGGAEEMENASTPTPSREHERAQRQQGYMGELPGSSKFAGALFCCAKRRDDGV